MIQKRENRVAIMFEKNERNFSNVMQNMTIITQEAQWILIKMNLH